MTTKKSRLKHTLVHAALIGVAALSSFATTANAAVKHDPEFGRYEIRTIPFSADLRVFSATYTPSGKVLVAYAPKGRADDRHINLAVMDDDGRNMRSFFSQKIPVRTKDNGLRYMVFADNKRIFMGDFILECAPNIDTCDHSQLVPVEYPTEVARGDHIWHSWSEIIVAPDNESIAWTTLLANYSAVVLSGKLERRTSDYKIAHAQIISTVELFHPDPRHPGGVIPNPLRNGEVKQFVNGGKAISLVAAYHRDTADSVVQHLASGEVEPITDTAGYNETTIFSPDEKLGIVMSTRFSPATDMAILGLIPRPHPVSLNTGLNMLAYSYAVTGVRQTRSGNIGPALIDIQTSKSSPDYLGLNLHTEEEWVYYSPMSWHPDSKRAMWMEGQRRGRSNQPPAMRMRVVHLLDRKAGKPVPAEPTPLQIPYASTDLSVIARLAGEKSAVDVTIHGRHSGKITFRRSLDGRIEKRYDNFSDNGVSVYDGSERMVLNPRGRSTYQADVTLSGPKPGRMDLQITFGPLHEVPAARLIFDKDDSGQAMTRGYAEYDGQRLQIDNLVP